MIVGSVLEGNELSDVQMGMVNGDVNPDMTEDVKGEELNVFDSVIVLELLKLAEESLDPEVLYVEDELS